MLPPKPSEEEEEEGSVRYRRHQAVQKGLQVGGQGLAHWVEGFCFWVLKG